MTAAPKKVLITGSSGYVGQHLISSLLAGGIDDDPDEGDDRPTGDDDDDDDGDGGGDGDGGDGGGGGPRYDLYLSYRSLPTFEDALEGLISSSRARGGTRRRRNRRPAAAARVVRTIPGVDFSAPGYLDDLLRGARGDDDGVGGGGGRTTTSNTSSTRSCTWRPCRAPPLARGSPTWRARSTAPPTSCGWARP